MFYKNKLKELREEKELKQKDVAHILNISLSSYGTYEIELDIMPINHLNTLASYYNVSLDYIFEFTNNPQYLDNKNEIDKKLSGQRLKEIRKSLKLSQKKLSDELHCSYGTISGYESGRYYISTSFLFDFCKNYNISADYLLGKSNNPIYIEK